MQSIEACSIICRLALDKRDNKSLSILHRAVSALCQGSSSMLPQQRAGMRQERRLTSRDSL